MPRALRTILVSSSLAACLVIAFLPALLRAADPPKTTPAQELDLLWGVKIPLRDGVQLNATVFKPHAMKAPLPVVFTLTPYVSDTYHDRGTYFANNGYVFAIVDARGRGNSEGVFDPVMQEAEDGHDVVEWLAAQPWCDGQVAMWGGSYAGYDQWATVKELPPHLVTIVPTAAYFPGADSWIGGILLPYDLQWLAYVAGRTGNTNFFVDSAFWISKFRRLYLEQRRFRDLPEVIGLPAPFFEATVAHPQLDAWHDSQVPSVEEFARIDLPILTITGHHDGDQIGALEYYKRHTRLAPARARKRHYLVIGPWSHAGTRTPTAEVGGLRYADASLIDMNELHKQWYDWTLKDGERPTFLKQRVAYYLAEAEEWKYADSLDAISPERLTLYLDSPSEGAGDVFHSGFLKPSPPTGAPSDQYVYDPLDLRPAALEDDAGENNLAHVLWGEAPTTASYARSLFGNGLVYHSEPLPADLEVTGSPRLVAWISMDVPDTDFAAVLYEVLPDGRVIVLSSEAKRARYRNSLREAELAEPGVAYRYEFDRFRFFSRRLSKGSRLRLVVHSPNSIYLQKNYNSGGVVAEETASDAKTAHIRLHHDAERASFLELPIAR